MFWGTALTSDSHRFLPCAEDVEACAPSGTRAATHNTTPQTER